MQALEVWREANCAGGTISAFTQTAQFFLSAQRRTIDKHGFWPRAGPWIRRTIALLQRRLLSDEVWLLLEEMRLPVKPPLEELVRKLLLTITP